MKCNTGKLPCETRNYKFVCNPLEGGAQGNFMFQCYSQNGC